MKWSSEHICLVSGDKIYRLRHVFAVDDEILVT